MKLGYENIDDDIVTEIGKFAVLWNMFERDCKCDASCEKIEEFSNRIPDNYDKYVFDKFTNVIRQRANNVYQSAPNALELYIENKLYPTDDDRARIGASEKTKELPMVKEYFKQHTKDNLIGAILAIKRIRNNMFHGLKEQFFKDFFEAINGVLEYLVSL